MTLGGAAQIAVTHCPNEWTLDTAVCSYNRPTYAPVSHTMAFTRQCSPATTHYFSSEYYQMQLIYPPRRNGRLSWPEHLMWFVVAPLYDPCKRTIIPPAFREDCGYPGIPEAECLSKKCCWDDSVVGVKWCFPIKEWHYKG